MTKRDKPPDKKMLSKAGKALADPKAKAREKSLAARVLGDSKPKKKSPPKKKKK